MNKFYAIKKYLNYYFNAKSKYKIHSPFIFDLLINVVYYKETTPEFDTIENIRINLKNNNNHIEYFDIGAEKGQVKRKIKDIAIKSPVNKKFCRLLYRLVSYYEPETIIELGTSLGISTMYMAVGIPKGKVISIEGIKDIAELAEKNFHDAELFNIKVINNNFDIALPEVIKDMKKVDFVFFDGNHTKKDTLNYFNLCLEKTTSESVFIFDDIHWSADMEEAWNAIQLNPKVMITLDLFSMGLVFFTKNTVKQNHIIKF